VDVGQGSRYGGCVLAYRTVAAEGESPQGHVLFLHGILGRGQNWRSIARRLVRARPEWTAVLVDLRLHGGSRDQPGPHTLAAAAGDLTELAASLDGPVHAVVGHSFGGKVALAWAAAGAAGLRELWVLDSPPGARHGGKGAEDVRRVFEALEGVAYPVASQDAFVQHLTGQGLSEGVARWLATNLERNAQDTLDLALDLRAIGDMLRDYYAQDLWAEVERPSGDHQVHVVVGERSDVFSADDRARAERAAGANPRVHLHRIPEAGHWLHVDAPDALVTLLRG
jgi:esterase